MIENDIKQQLISAGIGSDIDTLLGPIPLTPDNIIVITTTDSILTSSLNSLTSQALIPPGISDIQQTATITVRNNDYSAGQSKIWDIYNELVGAESGYKVCNGRKMFIMAAQPPHYSTSDDGKSIFVFNFVVNTSRDN